MSDDKQKQTSKEISKRLDLGTCQEKPKKPASPKKDDDSGRSGNSSKSTNR